MTDTEVWSTAVFMKDLFSLLSVSLLAEVVASAIKKINEAEMFTESLRNELSKYSFQQPEKESFEFTSKELTLL